MADSQEDGLPLGPPVMRRAALSYSKQRNAHGLVGLEVRHAADGKTPIAVPVVARSWRRADLPEIAPDIAKGWNNLKWDFTVADVLNGEHLLRQIRGLGVPVSLITTEKDLKDHRPVENLDKMDKVEQVQFALWLRGAGRLRWPANPSDRMKALENQVAMFTEHRTEAGGIDYYAPGEERDELVKALLAALFSARTLLQEGRGDQGLYGSINPDERLAEQRALGQQGEGGLTLYALLEMDRQRPDAFQDELASAFPSLKRYGYG